MSRREGLRDVLPRPQKQKAKSNAEKCCDYRERLKEDAARLELAKIKKKEVNARYRQQSTPEQKARKRELDRIAQQKRRERLKQEQSPKTVSVSPATRKKAKEDEAKLAEKREKARLRQQKRRQSMSSQKKRREREKRMESYYRKKIPQAPAPSPPKRTRTRWGNIFQNIKSALCKSRSRIALLKLDFVKRILSRQNDHALSHTRLYHRLPNIQSGIIQRFYQRVAVDLPGKKGASTPKKVLTKTLHDAFYDFKSRNPNMKVSFSTFKRRRPSNILLSSSNKFVQCLCEKCTNVMLLMNVLNKFLDKKPENRQNIVLSSKITSADELVGKTLCSEVSRDCVERKCHRCGIENFISVLKRRTSRCDNTLIKEWKRWEKTEKSSKDLVKKKDSLSTIICRLEVDLLPLAKHVKTAQWQRQQYQYLSENLPPFHGLCTMDFAENYLCKFQNEIQSAHWSYRQVTVHPCVLFYRCPEEGCGKRITEYLIFLSDDLRHDSFFANHVLDYCVDYVKSKSVSMLHVFSDGCGYQYKSKIPFHLLSQLQLKYPEVHITRHYFGSNHGKSLCDSSGGTVKNCATRAVASGDFSIQSAEEMLAFCQQKLFLNDEHHTTHVHRSFFLVNRSAIDRSQRLETLKVVKGTRSIHRLVPTKELDILKASELSCFCDVCLLGEEGSCENGSFTGELKSVEVVDKRRKVHPVSKRRKRKVAVTRSKVSHTQTVPNNTNTCPALNLNDAFIDSPDMPPLADSSSDLTPTPTAFCDSSDNSYTFLKDAFCNVIDPCPASPTGTSFPDLRTIFFDHIQSQMSSCKSFPELHELAMMIEPLLLQHPLPDVTPKSMLDVAASVDSIAYSLIPNDIKTSLFPVLTVADGNCVPRSISLLVFGDQDHHQEVRCRIVSELALNFHRYVSESEVSVNDLNAISAASDFYNGHVRETFELELLDVTKMCTFMGMWQLMAACNAFRIPIMSVYPSIGLKCHVALLNRTLYPKVLPLSSSGHKLSLFWSSTRSDMSPEYWTANHVVPLLPISLL